MVNETVNEEKLRAYWEFIKPTNDNEYLEIRFTDKDKNQLYYSLVSRFEREHPDIIILNKVQFFIQRFDQLFNIMTYMDSWFVKHFKICYGLNLKEKVDDTLGGGYKYTPNVRFVFFDIDRHDKNNLTFHTNRMLFSVVNDLVEYLKRYKLNNPTIIHSGGGAHIIYKIVPQKITVGKKLWYRDFVKSLISKQMTGDFCIDGIYDLTRVFGLPQSHNVKRAKRVFAVSISDYISDFKFRNKHLPKISREGSNNIHPIIERYTDIADSLEWKIFTHPQLPIGDIHTTILFSLKLLIKDMNISNWQELEDIANEVRGTNHSLDPSVGTENKFYHPRTIKNWMRKNKDFCLKYGFDIPKDKEGILIDVS